MDKRYGQCLISRHIGGLTHITLDKGDLSLGGTRGSSLLASLKNHR